VRAADAAFDQYAAGADGFWVLRVERSLLRRSRRRTYEKREHDDRFGRHRPILT
jgi:hypothetical protein